MSTAITNLPDVLPCNAGYSPSLMQRRELSDGLPGLLTQLLDTTTGYMIGWLIEAQLNSVLGVLFDSCPLKIDKIEVRLITVNMVNDWLVIRIWDKG